MLSESSPKKMIRANQNSQNVQKDKEEMTLENYNRKHKYKPILK